MRMFVCVGVGMGGWRGEYTSLQCTDIIHNSAKSLRPSAFILRPYIVILTVYNTFTFLPIQLTPLHPDPLAFSALKLCVTCHHVPLLVSHWLCALMHTEQSYTLMDVPEGGRQSATATNQLPVQMNPLWQVRLRESRAELSLRRYTPRVSPED